MCQIVLTSFTGTDQKSENVSDQFLHLQLQGEETLKCLCVCRPRAESSNIVSNDHERT